MGFWTKMKMKFYMAEQGISQAGFRYDHMGVLSLGLELRGGLKNKSFCF